jgi:hypothetical protein
MKHLTLFAAIGIFLATVSCGSARAASQEQQTKDQEKAQQIQQKLDSKDFTIDVNYMLPMRGSSEAISGSYSLSVKDNTVKSYLPYRGQATNIPYGGGDGLNFEDEIKEYKDSGLKKGSRTIQFKVEHDGDLLEYKITVFDNGQADIFVASRNRDNISFRGELDY